MPSSSPYQSRLLSFIARQSLRFREKSGQVLRQARTATLWSAQILLYPAYLLFQSGRLASRQLQQEFRQGFPLLRSKLGRSTPPPADAPVQKVLQTAQTFYLAPESLEPWPEARPLVLSQPGHPQVQFAPALQGIACLVETRSLILVAEQNQILDILTPVQQQQLSQRLIWEISDYYYRCKALVRQNRPIQSLPLPRQRPHLLPPVQGFRQLMGWVQRGPIAARINLFQEAVCWLPVHQAELKQDPPPPAPGNEAPDFTWFWQAKTQQQRSLQSNYIRQSEPWLTLEDLFETSSPAIPQLGTGAIVAGPPAPLVLQPAGQAGLAPTEAQERELNLLSGMIPSTVQQIAIACQNSASPGQAGAVPSEALRAAPDWIEAESHPLGYVKHPLEQLIGWLDRAILWVEEGLGRLSQWVRRHWLS